MANRGRHFLLPDLAQLRRNVKKARGLERINIERLYRCLEPDPGRSVRDVYDLHWVLVYLLEGTDEARENARSAVWIEAIGGGPAARPGHAWDRPDFFEMHLWISAAIASHVAVAMDWLASEGVFSRREIRAMSDYFVTGFWQHIYPHLKGKGRSPYFHDPINQDSSMVAGCLVIGHLFGTKWGKDPRAQRMYADALGQAGNVVWQSSPSGFDGDGFTYMRQIQPPVLSLIAMTIEEVEGQDFYFTEFGPGQCSIAGFMDKLQKFTLPSGYSYPHGRYGYVTEWNQYSQAYSARKTGQAHYLERVLTVPQKRFITPWVAMDLPLAVAWAPYGAMPGAPRKPLRPGYDTWHDTHLWSNTGSPRARIHAHMCWRRLHHGTFILEQGGERCVMLWGESAEAANGLYFADVGGRGASGTDFEHLHVGSTRIDKIQLRAQWDPGVIRDYTKYLMVMDNGTALSIDRYTAARPVVASYGLTTTHPIRKGTMVTELGKGKVQILCSLRSLGEKRVTLNRGEGKSHIEMTRHTTELPEADRGFVATLFNLGGGTVSAFRTAGDTVIWTKDKVRHELYLNNAYPAMCYREKQAGDAILELRSANDFILFSVRKFEAPHRRVWATCRVNIARAGDEITVKRAEYGNYVRYTDTDIDMCILSGSGHDIYVTSARPVRVNLPSLSDRCWVQVNGARAPVRSVGDGTVEVRIAACGPLSTSSKRPPVPAEVTRLGTEDLPLDQVISGLDAILRGHLTGSLDHARRYLDHEEVNVRLTAAEVLGYLGSESDAVLVGERLTIESHLRSPVGGWGHPWHGKWLFFPSTALMADALRKLGNRELVGTLAEALKLQYEPHAIGSIKMAMEVLAEGVDVW